MAKDRRRALPVGRRPRPRRAGRGGRDAADRAGADGRARRRRARRRAERAGAGRRSLDAHRAPTLPSPPPPPCAAVRGRRRRARDRRLAAVAARRASRRRRPRPGATPTRPTPAPAHAVAQPDREATASAPACRPDDQGRRRPPRGIALAGGDLWVMSPRQPPDPRRRGDGAGARQAPEGRLRRDRRSSPTATACGSRSGPAARCCARRANRQGPRALTIPGEPRGSRSTATASGSARLRAGRARHVLRYDRAPARCCRRSTCQRGRGRRWSRPPARSGSSSATRASSRGSSPGGDALVDCTRCPAPVRSMRYADGSCGSCSRTRTRSRASTSTAAARSPAPRATAPTQALVAGGQLFVASRNDHHVLVLDPRRCCEVGEPIRVGLNPSRWSPTGARSGSRRSATTRSRGSTTAEPSARAASAARFSFWGGRSGRTARRALTACP